MAQDFEKLNIQWFPGHMTKAQRMIEEHMKQVDAVCEILDARIPMASRNPDIDRLAGDKPRIVVLNRTDLADPKATARWHAAFQRQGMTVLETDSRSGKGVNGFAGAVCARRCATRSRRTLPRGRSAGRCALWCWASRMWASPPLSTR